MGVTASRNGPTLAQDLVLQSLVVWLSGNKVTEAHHGDCVGGDARFDVIIRYHFPEAWIHIHPPENERYRAFCNGPKTILHPQKPYIPRNHDIVDAVDLMIALPKEFTEQWQGSGTWATIRYSKSKKRQLHIVYPDGSVEIWKRNEVGVYEEYKAGHVESKAM